MTENRFLVGKAHQKAVFFCVKMGEMWRFRGRKFDKQGGNVVDFLQRN